MNDSRWLIEINLKLKTTASNSRSFFVDIYPSHKTLSLMHDEPWAQRWKNLAQKNDFSTFLFCQAEIWNISSLKSIRLIILKENLIFGLNEMSCERNYYSFSSFQKQDYIFRIISYQRISIFGIRFVSINYLWLMIFIHIFFCFSYSFLP